MYRKTIRRFINYFSGNTWKKTGIVLGLTFMLTAWLFFLDSREELPVTEDGRPYLERNSYGEGERRETLTVEMEGEEDVKSGISAKRETLEIDVGEREYDPEEIRQVLENEAKRLESLILGENENLETVRKDLNLISSIPGTAIEVTWELSDYTIMDITGRLNADALKEDGTLLEVTAVLNYKEEILRYTFPVCVYAPQLNASEKFLKRLSDAVEDEEQSTRSSGRVILPQEESGIRLTWSRKKEQRWLPVLLLGFAMAGLMLVKQRDEEKKKAEKKKEQMLLDYPGIVNKFMIYTGAGMTVRNAWGKLVRDYEENQRDQRRRYAYEEMRITWHELNDGIGERDCYERFASRCQLQPYMKFGALLAQNLRKGARGLSDLLQLEAFQAFEERKAIAKRQGEEAGTKLLLPMFLMLSVVLVIVVVPAFLSIQF